MNAASLAMEMILVYNGLSFPKDPTLKLTHPYDLDALIPYLNLVKLRLLGYTYIFVFALHQDNISVYCISLTPHFYKEKLGFTGVFIIFLFLL